MPRLYYYRHILPRAPLRRICAARFCFRVRLRHAPPHISYFDRHRSQLLARLAPYERGHEARSHFIIAWTRHARQRSRAAGREDAHVSLFSLALDRRYFDFNFSCHHATSRCASTRPFTVMAALQRIRSCSSRADIFLRAPRHMLVVASRA